MAKTLVIAEKPSVGRDLTRRPPRLVHQARGLPRVRRPRRHVGGRPPRPARRARRVRPEVQEVADGRPADRARRVPARRARRALAQADDGDQRKLLGRDDVDDVVNACDAGREGELIFAWLYEKAGAKKPVAAAVAVVDDHRPRSSRRSARCAPARSSTRLEEAARSRSEADWIVGMNATRAATIRLRSSFDGAVSLGRVQTPTLAILARREVEIREFKPEKYWLVDATFEPHGGREGPRATRAASTPAPSRGSPSAEEAEAIVAAVRGQAGRDHQARDDDEEGARAAPLRPDLAPARGQHALRLLGPPHARRRPAALRGAQGAHLPAHQLALPVHRHGRRDQADGRGRGQATPTTPSRPRYVTGLDVLPLGRVINDAKVTDHHAIIPTRSEHRTEKMSDDDKKVYDMVVAALPRRLPSRRGVGEHAARDHRRRARLPHPRPRAARAGLARRLRRGRGRARRGARRRRRRAPTRRCPSSSATSASTRARWPRPRRRPSRRGATPTRRCWARWRPPASSSTTTSCARR